MCLLIFDCVLFIVLEKVFLEVIIDLGKDFPIAFSRHLESPLSKLRFFLERLV